jgi:acyl dehydratase
MLAITPADAKLGYSLPKVEFGPVSRSTLALYAGASGDHNPIHIDIDFAKRAGMKDVFAHGMLSMAQVARVVTDWAGIDKVRSIDVRFKSLTHIGDKISCGGEIVDAFCEDNLEFVRVKLIANTSEANTTVVGEAIVQVT